jgi:hypothetical protein
VTKIETRTVVKVRIELAALNLSIGETWISLFNGFKETHLNRMLRATKWVDEPEESSKTELKRYELIGKLLLKY